MKIYELVKKLNTKMSVKYTDVITVKRYYLSLYRAYMVSLYDKGFISDPTIFDKREIYKNIVDMDIKHLTGVTGKIELDEDYIGFACAKYKNNSDIYEFLSTLLNIIKYRKISLNIDKFHDDCELSGSSKKKISLNMVQAASRIYSKNGHNIDEGILKCLYGLSSEIDFVSLDEVIYNTALKELGLSEVNGDDSLFVDGLTRDEEIRYSSLILNGLVKLDGKYADKLVLWLKDNKWSNDNKFSSQNEGLYNWVAYIKTNDMMEKQSNLLNSLIDDGKEIVGMSSTGYYILSDRSELSIPVGAFAVVSDDENEEVLPDINKLEGYTGEVYSLSFLNRNGISYVGCPIELYYKDNKKALYIDKEQTDMSDSISWFKHIKADLSFDETFDCKRLGGDSLEGKLQKILVNAERGIFVSKISIDDYLSITDSVKKEAINSIY